MMISRVYRQPGSSVSATTKTSQPSSGKEPDIGEFIDKYDYSGAIAVLEFYKEHNKKHPQYEILPWLGYCAFHLGDYEKSMNVYKEMLKQPKCDKNCHLYLACCMFFLGMYKDAQEEAELGPDCSLKTRLLFHISDKLGDDNKVMMYHQNLSESTEDQLSLASMYFLRNHFEESNAIYKKIYEENAYLALNVYMALCFYKLDYYDVSLESLSKYLNKYPQSAIAINLKACNFYKLYSGKAAEAELLPILELQKSTYCIENELIKHNLVVFRNGENALQVFPKLLDIIPEARLNLAIYHLKRNAIDEAYDLIKDLEPIKAQDYILKAVVFAAYGQLYESKEHLQKAQKWFQLVGTSASEMDTIPGRQCMASCFFILRKWDDVILYLNSIKQFFENDDDFLWNLGLAHASAGHYKEAEKLLLNIQNENYKQDFCYKAWLARCYIMNKKPGLAWDIYFKMEASNDSIGLVQLIANECYKTGQFYFAAKAFDVLERIDPNPEYWDGKRGACVGVFQQVLAGEEPVDTLREIINMLRVTKNSQALYIIRIMNEQLGVKASQQVSI